ncbi:MAG: hypothetical protein HY731_06120 [Candidatus Tectomicrobia bacterium]|nr:hypothetical protein [Candidatus Tectomicrobia bacterium]
MPHKRYEILLPEQYNDGTDIEPEKFGITKDDLLSKFGAVSVEDLKVSGLWYYQGTPHTDTLQKWWVDVADTKENYEFLKEFKGVLRERFKQHEIWMIATSIELV